MGKSLNNEEVTDELEENNPVESEKPNSSIDALEKVKEEEVVLKTIPRPPSPFPQWLRKTADDA